MAEAKHGSSSVLQKAKQIVENYKVVQYAISIVFTFVALSLLVICTNALLSGGGDKSDKTDRYDHIIDELEYHPSSSQGISITYPQDDWIPEGCVHWHDARQYVNDYAILYGNVVSVGQSDDARGGLTYLDVGTASSSHDNLRIVIRDENRSDYLMPPEEMYMGKNVGVNGKVYIQDDMYCIEITSPNHIQIFE